MTGPRTGVYAQPVGWFLLALAVVAALAVTTVAGWAQSPNRAGTSLPRLQWFAPRAGQTLPPEQQLRGWWQQTGCWSWNTLHWSSPAEVPQLAYPMGPTVPITGTGIRPQQFRLDPAP